MTRDNKKVMVIPWQQRGMDCMRVAFSGSAGTGKTTLAKSVNEFLQYPFYEEGIREYLKKHDIEHLREMNPTQSMKMHLSLFNHRRNVEEQSLKCVSDRSTYDNAVYALYWLGREKKLQRGLLDYARDCSIHAVTTYDIIFVLPNGQFDLEDDGTRSVLPAYQQSIQLMIESAVQGGFPFHFVHQVQAVDPEERVAECLEIIDKAWEKKAEHAADLPKLPEEINAAPPAHMIVH